MEITLLTWGLTLAVILGLFVFDFFAHVRVPHEPTLRESGFWSAVYIGIAIVFGIFVWWRWGGGFAGEYFAGYVTEKALSVDNLFVFVVIMAKFAVPRVYQQKVLLLGIVMALVMRGVFIGLGAAAIARYSWVFYLFGVILILTAINMLRDSDEPAKEGRIERFAKRHLRTSEGYDGDRMFTRVDGRAMATPLLLVLIVIGFTDLLFAFDSIPAIYGLTQEPYLVFTANAFALMGLRQLFFLIGGLLDRLVFLAYGLSFILAFIGVKLVLHALHENSLGFINGGEPVGVPEISTGLSLAVIGTTLVVTTVASLLHSARRDRREAR
ncbi:TerC family protein [Gordonia crocea]|uniref:Tellurium resistance protein TerC n=1 Tax=Gordonia crocea TaxID=589162 RepID=A0A7I9UZA9_9ACTN|nr:TerC family protein [Gordonia crocea]GED98181.1 tellurium resistance protein TerC [Gordonia crocea]